MEFNNTYQNGQAGLGSTRSIDASQPQSAVNPAAAAGGHSPATAHGSAVAQRPSAAPARAKRPDPAAERLAEEMRVFNKVVEELRAKLNLGDTVEGRYAQIAHFATELFGVSPTWAAFYREVMGKEGVIWALLPDLEVRVEYELSQHYGQILEMLTALRSRDLPENDPTEPQRMVTIRMPKSLYDVLCDESNQLKISVNKLCISRITQRLDPEVIPVTEKKRRGRRPGSAGQEDQAAIVKANASSGATTGF